jgi:hypothetical protein
VGRVSENPADVGKGEKIKYERNERTDEIYS